MRAFFFFIVFVSIAFAPVHAQMQPDNSLPSEILSDIEIHLGVLCNDSLLGRETGTLGEKKACLYIASVYSQIGLNPIRNASSYLLPFSFTDGFQYSSVLLNLNNKRYSIEESFAILNSHTSYTFEANIFLAGTGITRNGHNPYPDSSMMHDKVIVLDVNYKAICTEPFDKNVYFQYLQQAINDACHREPAAVVLASSDFANYPVSSQWVFNVVPLSIPVILSGEKLSTEILKSDGKLLSGASEEIPKQGMGNNVAGMINNGANDCIVIGAHYDHLGLGDLLSRYSGERQVFNGADDNASGVAGLLALARRMNDGRFKNHNYIFVAFSGEEKGLLGSKAFVSNQLDSNEHILAMINFDMIGRMNDKREINVIGVGTSLLWDSLLNVSNQTGLSLQMSNGGMGGSDQLSFYLQDIPVLFFITGLHRDYHTPFDDLEKINQKGIVDMVLFAELLMLHLDSTDSLGFVKVANEQTDRSYRKGVTLGIIPDHAYGGKGLRIDDVTPDKAASKAGMQPGDIIIAIGEHEVTDIMTYMKALQNYKKGDNVKIVYLRGQNETEVMVTF